MTSNVRDNDTPLAEAIESATGERLVPLPYLLQRLSVSRATAYRMIARGELPQPVKLGSRMIRFRLSELDSAIAKLAPGV